ncbi:MAG: hypothetical protein LBL67_00910 [Coriobacteriales bacterium]|jgi:hypothetical protein|nr:hypothetical protein [Coriobacteriales bacterium]
MNGSSFSAPVIIVGAVVIAAILIVVYALSVWLIFHAPRYANYPRRAKIANAVLRVVLALISIAALEYIWIGVLGRGAFS